MEFFRGLGLSYPNPDATFDERILGLSLRSLDRAAPHGCRLGRRLSQHLDTIQRIFGSLIDCPHSASLFILDHLIVFRHCDHGSLRPSGFLKNSFLNCNLSEALRVMLKIPTMIFSDSPSTSRDFKRASTSSNLPPESRSSTFPKRRFKAGLVFPLYLRMNQRHPLRSIIDLSGIYLDMILIRPSQ